LGAGEAVGGIRFSAAGACPVLVTCWLVRVAASAARPVLRSGELADKRDGCFWLRAVGQCEIEQVG
jgi:hypothetical protein